MIRRADKSDLPALMRMAQAFAESIDPGAFDSDHCAATIGEWIRNPAFLVLVDDDSRGMICMCLGMLPYAPRLVALELCFWVDPEYRGLGLGGELRVTAERESYAEGAAGMIMVDHGRTGIGAAYQADGYILIQRELLEGVALMGIATAIAATAAAVSAGASVYTGVRGAKEAKKAGRAQEQAEGIATAESVRRLGKEREAVVGTQTATAAAMGVDVNVSKSLLELRKEAVDEYSREISTTQQIGAANASAIRSQTRTAQLTGYGQAIQGVAGFAQAGHDSGWWGIGKKPT